MISEGRWDNADMLTVRTVEDWKGGTFGVRRKEEGVRRKEEGGRRKEEGGRRKEEGGRRKGL